jgi:hypothetical protein
MLQQDRVASRSGNGAGLSALSAFALPIATPLVCPGTDPIADRRPAAVASVKTAIGLLAWVNR